MKNKKLICSLLSAALVMPMFSGIVFAVPTGVAVNSTNFPDEIFRSYVLNNCDGNKDGYLSNAEIATVTKLDIGLNDITNPAGIGYFTSLEELYCNDCNFDYTIDFSLFPNLKVLYCSACGLDELDLSKNTNLEYLMCAALYDLTSLDISNNTKLKYLDCSNTDITNLDLSNLTSLMNLDCSGNALTTLNLNACTSLEEIDCSENNLTTLNLENCSNLTYLDCSHNNISTLNINGCTSLKNIYCEYNNLSALDLSTNTALAELYCYDNNLALINVSDCPELKQACEFAPVDDGDDDFVYGEQISEEEFDERCDADLLVNTVRVNGVSIFFKNILWADSTTSVQTENKSGAVSFAERLYTEALGRNYDEAGRDYWVSKLRSGVSGAEVARQFFFSEEFINANLSDEVFVDRLYGTFMDRVADEGGKTYWLSQLSTGAMTREDVFNGFINSPEWANICLEAGIVSGGTGVPTITVEPSEAVTAFATRLYTTCLGRAADSEGVTWWATELANMRRTGTTAAEGFFFSDEYVNANHSDAEFVTALYSTFMNRAYDQAGYDYWMGELASGCTRENVLERFAGCDEFGNICADAGIIR